MKIDYKAIIITVLIILLLGIFIVQCNHEPQVEVKYKTKVQTNYKEKIVYRDTSTCISASTSDISSGSGLEYFEDIPIDNSIDDINGVILGNRFYDAEYAKVYCNGHIEKSVKDCWINCSGEWIIKVKERIH